MNRPTEQLSGDGRGTTATAVAPSEHRPSSADARSRATPEALVACAGELVPRLRERIAETEDLRQLPEATLRDAIDGGLFALLLPASLGGAAGGVREYAEVIRTLATGDPSAAWVLGFFITHNWFMARWPAQAQADYFGFGRPALLAGVANPPGSATATDGGYLISGTWGYCSGVMHADWVQVAAVGEGDREPSHFILPRDEVTVLDTWHVNGMKGTGSHSVQLTEAFVPAHRRITTEAWMSRANPGSHLHPEPIYSYDARDATIFMIPAIILGAAEAVVELYHDRLNRRHEVFSRQLTGDTPTGQLRYARAVGATRAARAALDRAITLTIETNARQAESMSDEIRAHIKLDCLTSARLSWEAVEDCLGGSGSGFHQCSDPTQHFVRDIQVAMSHLTLDQDVMGVQAGAILLGRAEPGSARIFL